MVYSSVWVNARLRLFCLLQCIRASLKLFSALITLIVLQAKTLKAWQLKARRLVVDSLNLHKVVIC